MQNGTSRGRFVAIFIGSIIFLGGFLQWFFGNLLYNCLWTILGNSLGLREADLISYILGNFIPFALAAGIAAVIYSAMRYEMHRTPAQSRDIAATADTTPTPRTSQPGRKPIPVSLIVGLAAVALSRIDRRRRLITD